MGGIFDIQPIDIAATGGPRATFGEVRRDTLEREQLVGEVSSRNTFENDVYDPFVSFFNSTIRPMDPDFFSYGVEGSPRQDAPGSPISLETFRLLEDQTFHPDEETLGRVISELDAAGIEYPAEILPEAIDARRSDLSQAMLARVNALDERIGRGRGASGLFGQLVGGFQAGFDNVESVATMPIGATSRMGILLTALVEGSVNAATEAATTPKRNEFLRQLGIEEESILENTAFGFAVGGTLGGTLRTATRGLEIRADRRAREQLATLAQESNDPAIQAAAQAVLRDLEDEAAVVPERDPTALEEHTQRAQAAAVAARGAEAPDIPDRPAALVLTPGQRVTPTAIPDSDGTVLVDPRALLVQPDVFQFKSDTVAAGGVTAKLQNVFTWVPHRAGITMVYEYADGAQAIADGHQRTALARRIMEQDPSQQILLRAEVFREADGFSVEDVRVLAALKNIAEAADGMTARMAGDAAKVLRLRPEEIADLPRGPGIARAQNLSKLSDDAFDLYINRVIDERFAELIGRNVADPAMHLPIARLIERVRPETSEQAENIIAQALEAPTSRETTSDLFGETEVVESLFLEQAKVLERAVKLMREDRSVFRTITDQAERIEGAGANRLDAATNAEARKQIENALAVIKSLAHRAGPISEALRDGAKSYKENGRLKDAAERVADAVRGEVQRNGITGAGSRNEGRATQPGGASSSAPDPNQGFDDPLGPAAEAQVKATRIVDPPRARPAEPEAAPEFDGTLESTTAPEDIVMPVDPALPPDQQRAILQRMTEENRGIVRDLIEEIDSKFGTKSGDNVKALSKVTQKASRPSILAKKPWHTVAHIRDSYRFKTSLNTFEDVPGIFDLILARGIEIVKIDTGKLFNPGEWGWRIIAFDMRMPNGQLVEYYLPLEELELQKKAEGHLIFEEWRNKTPEQIVEQNSEYMAAIAKSFRGYDEAFSASLERMGISREDAEASWNKAENSLREAARNSASSSGITTSPADGVAVQEPSSVRVAEKSPTNSSAREVPVSISAKSVMGDTSATDIGSPGRAVNGAASEATPAGEQTLVPGVAPVTQRDRLEARMNAPKAGGSAGSDTQIGGLFDPNDPSRFDLFDMVPVGQSVDADGRDIAVTVSRSDLAAELDADDEFNEILGVCLK